MKKCIYHGSVNIIKKPIFGYGKIHNDYGLGFYCTEDIELAKEWAVNKIQNGFANKYELELDGLKTLDLNQPQYCVMHWLALLLNNRTFQTQYPLAQDAKEYILKTFLIDVNEYDVIIGYRADDSYFAFANDFINGAISYRQLCYAIKLGDLGQQIVLKSEKAFNQISFLEAIPVEHGIYYPKKNQRDIKARQDYISSKTAKREKGDIYINQILNEEMQEDDPRLQ